MADLRFIAETTSLATGTTAKCLIQLEAPTNQRVKILGWGVSFEGTETTILATPADTVTTSPIDVRLIKGTAAGTYANTLGAVGTYGSVTVLNGVSQTVQTSVKSNATGNTVATGVVDSANIGHTDLFEKFFPEGQEPILNGGEFLAIECHASVDVSCRTKIICEE